MSKTLTLSNTASGQKTTGTTTSNTFSVAVGDDLEYEVSETPGSPNTIATYSTILTCN
jgi:hypothetical protein